MLIVCLFGKFLGLNSHFQNILATINKITASIKTLLPAALPTTVQAATITHGDVSLHIDYFEILLYAIQIMTTCHGSVICYLANLVHCTKFTGIVLTPEILAT